jgi:hypothetical protein
MGIGRYVVLVWNCRQYCGNLYHRNGRQTDKQTEKQTDRMELRNKGLENEQKRVGAREEEEEEEAEEHARGRAVGGFVQARQSRLPGREATMGVGQHQGNDAVAK